jgi:hypothetical protein
VLFCPNQVIAAMLDAAPHALLISGKPSRAQRGDTNAKLHHNRRHSGLENNDLSETISLAARIVLNRVKEMAATNGRSL